MIIPNITSKNTLFDDIIKHKDLISLFYLLLSSLLLIFVFLKIIGWLVIYIKELCLIKISKLDGSENLWLTGDEK